jgi:lysyl-tRNA synthetase class 2
MIETINETMKDKQLKLAEKEGAKKGQDIIGLRDIGGVNYFHVALEHCDGNWELVETAMKAANITDGNTAENIAKAFLSASEDRLCIYLHVPESLSDTITLKDWFSVLVQGSKATVLHNSTNDSTNDSTNGTENGTENEMENENKTKNEGKWGFAKAELLRSDNVFPLKVRDEIIGQGFAYLVSKGVIPDDDSDEYEINDDVVW